MPNRYSRFWRGTYYHRYHRGQRSSERRQSSDLELYGNPDNRGFSRSIFNRAGSQTTATIVFHIYDDFGGTGNLITSYGISAATAAQSYDPIDHFDFTNITLNPATYSATLTSNTKSTGSFQYFLKNGGLKLYTDNGTLTPGPELLPTIYTTDGNTTGTSNPEPAPEPSSLVTLALTGLLALRRRRA